jgi:hypothetical protein
MESIVDNHAYWRNIWLWTCFSLGTINTYNYYTESLYVTNIYLYLLPALFTTYLTWDCYKMLACRELYRLDLLIHHFVCYCSYVYIAYYKTWLFSSIVVTCENLSLFNYWLSLFPPSLLKYKLFIIICYRIPFWIWFMYMPPITEEYKDHSLFLLIGCTFFLCYDLFMVKKIIQNPILFKHIHTS